MENKYYKPTIEDLFIGYECIIKHQASTKLIKDIRWHSIKISCSENLEGKRIAFNRIPNMLKRELLLTLFLTKEQIEKEGWKEIEDNKLIYIKTGLFILNFSFNENGPIIGISYNDSYHKGHYFFSGQCKSINEFRKICKYLNI